MSKQQNRQWIFEDTQAIIGNNVVTFERNVNDMTMVSLRHIASVELNSNIVFINIDQGDASSHEPAFFQCIASTKEDARDFFEALKQKIDYGNQISDEKTDSTAQRTCPYCKSMISSDSKFCGHCGASLT
jgi:hypothetical protein